MTKNEHKVVQRCAFASVYAGAGLERRVVCGRPASMDKESVMKLAPRPMDEDAGAVGLADATRASTMMAIAQRRYGQPDVLEYTAVDKPVVGDDDVLVRVHAAAPPRRLLPHDRRAVCRAPGVRAAPATERSPRNGPGWPGRGGRQERAGTGAG